MKRVLALILAGLMVFTAVGCGKDGDNDAKDSKFHIGVVTSTVSQGEDELQTSGHLILLN